MRGAMATEVNLRGAMAAEVITNLNINHKVITLEESCGCWGDMRGAMAAEVM